MNVPIVLFLVALIFALIDLIQGRGRSLTGWAVVLTDLGLLWATFLGILK